MIVLLLRYNAIITKWFFSMNDDATKVFEITIKIQV